MTLYHGDYDSDISAHEGMCLTDDDRCAEAFGRYVFSCRLDLHAFVVEDCDGYDPIENEAPADCAKFRAAAAARGVDILRYADADEFGRELTCYRLVSARAVAACHLTLVD